MPVLSIPLKKILPSIQTIHVCALVFSRDFQLEYGGVANLQSREGRVGQRGSGMVPSERSSVGELYKPSMFIIPLSARVCPKF